MKQGLTIAALLSRYAPQDAGEEEARRRILAFLEQDEDNQVEDGGPFGRTVNGEADWRGHITGSAWIVNEEHTQTLLVHHAKLGIWVQPGGHCDGQGDVLAVAAREAREETGLTVRPLSEDIFDLDIHTIPPYWNTPSHFHYDVRFLFCADESTRLIVSAESHAVRWVPLDEVAALNPQESLARMVRKSQELQF